MMDRASLRRPFPGGPRRTNLVPLSSRRLSRPRQFIDRSNLDIAGAGDPVEFSVVVSGGRRDHIERGSLFPSRRKRKFVGLSILDNAAILLLFVFWAGYNRFSENVESGRMNLVSLMVEHRQF